MEVWLTKEDEIGLQGIGEMFEVILVPVETFNVKQMLTITNRGEGGQGNTNR